MPADARLRPVQAEAVRAAGSLSTPGMIIIEAPMGCGKTEASLLCAEVLANRFDEGGLAYLLPTQATSNAMYTRVESWLEGVHADDDPDSPQDIHLLHGKAALNEDWSSRLRWNGSWMGDGRHADDAVIAHQWFGGRKRGLLAPFVVGTVDQLLFMALNAKHVHLRHLGLAGKVVVIDEIHAYDAYMNVYLDRALAFLGKYRVPVVLLSATLPPARREQLVQAYRGIDRRNSRRRKPLPPAPRTSSGAPCYPLVTCSAADRKEDPVYLPCDSDTRNTEFAVEYLPDDDDSLVKLIRESLVDGGCICVLRNTVGRAQKAFRLLSSELDANVKLVHSRFIASDRVRNDEALLEALGPDSSHRPHSLVVVGTQVIEQSLDIDFDMIVTDIAPIDLLLQRMGRVHRHQRGAHESERPASLRNARCVITGIEAWEGDLPRFERGTAFVYRPAVLMRTVLALREEKSGGTCRISLPGDIAPLVEAVYDEDGERLAIPDDWEADYAEAKGKWSAERLEKERRAASWLLKNPGRVELVGWMDNKTGLDDEAKGVAKVRDSQESIEVTVVVGNEAGYELLPWVAREQGVDASLGTGAEVPDDSVAHAAALCTVSLPPMMSMPYCSDAVIDALERAGHYEEWQQSRWLKGALPLVLDERGDAAIAITIGNKTERKEVFKLHYSRTEGLSCVKEEGES